MGSSKKFLNFTYFLFKETFKNKFFLFGVISTPILFFVSMELLPLPPTLTIFIIFFSSLFIVSFLTYSITFYTLRRSSIYLNLQREINNKLPIYLSNYLINLFFLLLTFAIFILCCYIFESLNLFYYELENAYFYRGVNNFEYLNIFYYIMFFSILMFTLLFLIQNIVNNLQSFIMIFTSLWILLLLFSGLTTASFSSQSFQLNGMETPMLDWKSYFESGWVNLKLVNFNGHQSYQAIFSAHQHLYSDRNTYLILNSNLPGYISLINPFYWLNRILISATFMVKMHFPVLIEGMESFGIDPNIPLEYCANNIFSFKDLSWLLINLYPLFCAITFGSLALYISKTNSKLSNKNHVFNVVAISLILIFLICFWLFPEYKVWNQNYKAKHNSNFQFCL